MTDNEDQGATVERIIARDTPTDDEREALCDQCGEVFSEHSCRPIPSCIHVPERRADLCEWCDMSARGNAHHPAHDQPRRSCGEQYHGEDFKPDPEPNAECHQPCEHLSQQDAREGRTCAEHPCTCPEPQGEPSEAQVDAASREIDLRGFHIPPMAVRAALRAAWAAR